MVSCPLCGADQARPLYRSERPFMRIVRCRPCGMMYQNPQIAEAGMEDAYQSFEEYGRYASLEEGKRKLFESRIRRFERQWKLPEEGAFLDVGASRGVMLDAVRALLPKWRVAGVEISPSARAALLVPRLFRAPRHRSARRRARSSIGSTSITSSNTCPTPARF